MPVPQHQSCTSERPAAPLALPMCLASCHLRACINGHSSLNAKALSDFFISSPLPKAAPAQPTPQHWPACTQSAAQPCGAALRPKAAHAGSSHLALVSAVGTPVQQHSDAIMGGACPGSKIQCCPAILHAGTSQRVMTHEQMPEAPCGHSPCRSDPRQLHSPAAP
jgi:hypothetical protein